MQSDNIGNKLDLLRLEIANSTRHLSVDMPRVDEQHLILSLPLRFASIEEPERARQCDRVKEVRADLVSENVPSVESRKPRISSSANVWRTRQPH